MKLGTDFELPLINNEGVAVPAHLFTKGTKSKPEPLSHGFVQWDNAMVEFNTKPAMDKSQFVGGIFNVMREWAARWPQLKYEYADVMHYDQKFVNLDELQMLGCDRDFNAYSGKWNPVPEALKRAPFRTAGFHIHIDVDLTGKELYCYFVRALEYYVGLAMVPFEKRSIRRNYYGMPGSFRPKKYGVEWRTPSSSLLQDKKALGIIYDRVCYVVENWQRITDFLEKMPDVNIRTEQCILRHEEYTAEQLLSMWRH